MSRMVVFFLCMLYHQENTGGSAHILSWSVEKDSSNGPRSDMTAVWPRMINSNLVNPVSDMTTL